MSNKHHIDLMLFLSCLNFVTILHILGGGGGAIFFHLGWLSQIDAHHAHKNLAPLKKYDLLHFVKKCNHTVSKRL